jgi:hypothetical protein
MDNDEDQIEEIPSRPLTDEEQYFYERSYKELVESIPRIEDVAKFLIGATATTSGLFLAAFKLARGDKTVTEPFWFAPFLCWSLSIAALMLVLFPYRYETGRAQPAAWKQAFLRARSRKYGWLAVGAGFFILGLLSALYPFVR